MQVEFNNQTLDKRCMSTVQLLLDIETLAHTDYMTGTLNSGIPYLIEVRTFAFEFKFTCENCCAVPVCCCRRMEVLLDSAPHYEVPSLPCSAAIPQ